MNFNFYPDSLRLHLLALRSTYIIFGDCHTLSKRLEEVSAQNFIDACGIIQAIHLSDPIWLW